MPSDGSLTKYGWAGAFEDGWSPYGAWVARPGKFNLMPDPPANPPVFILVHGGPLPIDTFAGMDNLATWIAARGGIGVAIKYPMLLADGTWQQGVAAIQQAITKGRASGAPSVTLVGHSAGGLFLGLTTFGAVPGALPDRTVYVAADDQVGNWPQPTQPPNPRTLYGANKVPVDVFAGGADPTSTVDECQAIATALNAAGHPGKWTVLDGAGHSDILSDITFIKSLVP
jgi:hypothetical protein